MLQNIFLHTAFHRNQNNATKHALQIDFENNLSIIPIQFIPYLFSNKLNVLFNWNTPKTRTLQIFCQELISCEFILFFFSFWIFCYCWFYLNAYKTYKHSHTYKQTIVMIYRLYPNKRRNWGFAESLSRSLWHIKVKNATNSSDSVGIGSQLFRFLLWNYKFTSQSLSFG